MAGRVAGKVAFVTGAARGQGRSHAIRLAEEGADIIAVDVQTWDEVTPAVWQDTIDTNLTGVWHTIVAAVPHLIGNDGGSIICISSTAGIKGLPFFAPYVAPKHGVVGLAKSMANELARPTSGSTPSTRPA
jgi:NAD(P)-dependent dehydrogenase (short-subunit alcohol dehydrogenase family)